MRAQLWCIDAVPSVYRISRSPWDSVKEGGGPFMVASVSPLLELGLLAKPCDAILSQLQTDSPPHSPPLRSQWWKKTGVCDLLQGRGGDGYIGRSAPRPVGELFCFVFQ